MYKVIKSQRDFTYYYHKSTPPPPGCLLQTASHASLRIKADNEKAEKPMQSPLSPLVKRLSGF